MERLRLGSDPWSDHVRVALRESPHAATLALWEGGKPPEQLDTPYVEYLTVQKGASREVAAQRQADFHALWRAAPAWWEPPLQQRATNWAGPIAFRIRDNGDIGCDDGFHRLNILHRMGLPLEGVLVERDAGWAAFRERVRERMLSGWKGGLYHPIPHPDFDAWPVRHPAPVPLVGLLAKRGIRSAIDLGTHFGWALYSLRAHLASGVGIEKHPAAFEVADLVLPRVRMRAERGDVTKRLRASPPVDLALALSVLHHVKPLDPLLALLRVRARFVAVTMPNASEAGSQKLPPTPHEYVREKLGASVEWEGEHGGRRLQLLKANA